MERRTFNVVLTYLSAHADGYDDAREWYRDAHQIAVKLDPADISRAAGVIAALSPQTDWERNVALAHRAYRDGRATGTLGRNCAKATTILAGEPAAVVLRGDKVRSFWRLVCDPSDEHTVCVDRHAIAIADGDPSGGRRTITSTQYAAYARAYRAAAREVSRTLGYRVTPAEVQSVTWTWWRDNVKSNRRGLIGDTT